MRNRWWPRSPLRAVDCARSRRRTARRPSARVNSEADLIWVLAHDLDRDQRGFGDLLTGTPAVGEDPLDERESAARDSYSAPTTSTPDLLGRLTNDDLKDIGVASFGHRKKLLDAIAALVATPEATAPIPDTAPEPKAQDTAERRRVTLMFSDLVGSTALTASMDPEDLRERGLTSA